MEIDESPNELIEQFQSITGCSVTAEAQHYVEACGNDLTKALNLYFAQQSRGNAKESAGRPCVNGGASTSKESSSGLGNSGKSDNNADPEHVRAPIAPVRGPIVEQSFQQTYRSRVSRMPRENVFDRFGSDFRAEAESQLSEMQRQLLSHGRENGEEDSDNSRDGSDSRMQEKERSLRGIFQPPFDLRYNGNWEQARVDAERASRWLLVNIQDPSEFASQVLNRDVWANSAVKEVVKNNFLFWQVFHESADGARIASYYKITDYPAIFIVDPRTGELVKRLRATDAISFTDDLTTFLERFPDYETHDKQQYGYAPSATAVSISNGKSKTNKGRDGVDRKGRKRHLEVDMGYEDYDRPGPSSRMKKVKQNVEKDVEEITDLIKNGHKLIEDKEDWQTLIGAPTADTIELELVLRMPNGERKNISVPDSTPLKALFAFINEQGYAANDHIVVLLYPKREYNSSDSELTLRELKFSRRELVHVEKKYY